MSHRHQVAEREQLPCHEICASRAAKLRGKSRDGSHRCSLSVRALQRAPHLRAAASEQATAIRHAILAAVTSIATLCAQLQSTWREEIPLAAAMAIEVLTFADAQLLVRAPLTANKNVHGTAFAGSLFSICVLTGWGRIWLALRREGLDGQIVVADSQIKYRKAVTGEILCRCALDDDAERANVAAFAASGRASWQLTCTIDGATGPAVTYEAKYVVLAKRDG
jgi:thioesterase domain-containing protein